MTIFLFQTTGLTGLAVAKSPHVVLTTLYERILRTTAQMPEEAAYKKSVEEIVNHRLQIIKTEPDVLKVEAKVNSGHIEEIILQAQRELSLAQNMLVWRPWEPLISEAPKNQWRWPIA